MKVIHKRLLAAVLTAVMLMPAASCSKGRSKDSKSISGKKISEDSPWFESTVRKYDLGLVFEDPVSMIRNEVLDDEDKNLVIWTTGQYMIKTTGRFDQPARWFGYVSVVDRTSGKVESQTDLVKGLSKYEQPDDVSFGNGVITARYSKFNDSTYEMTYFEKDIDPSTGEILDTREVTGVREDVMYSKTDDFNEYVITTTVFYGEPELYCTLDIKSPDGSTKTVEIREEGKNYYGPYYFYPLSDTRAMVPVGSDDGVVFFELDLASASITKCDKESMSWLDLSSSLNTFMRDGRAFYYSNVGFFEIDYKNRTVNEFFDYGWCGVNRNLLATLRTGKIKGDTICFQGAVLTNGVFSQSISFDFYEVELKKAEKNPHAGKQILELYSAGGNTSDVVSDAILEFNRTNGQYYIEVTDRYDDDRSYLSGYYYVDEELERVEFNAHYNITNEDDRARIELSQGSKLSDSLAVDIINGDGPDILMNVSGYGQLNNPDYLTDLTPYIGELDPAKYFTNIIGCAKVSDQLEICRRHRNRFYDQRI